MKHANEQRMAANSENNQAESIQISKFWEEELKAMPYLSSKYIVLATIFDPAFLLKKKMGRPSIFSSLVPKRYPRIRRGRRLMCWDPLTTSSLRRPRHWVFPSSSLLAQASSLRRFKSHSIPRHKVSPIWICSSCSRPRGPRGSRMSKWKENESR